MPTYEYLCKTCGHRFETWQKMIEDPLTTCPECGAQIRRVLFPANVVFKGSGFYKTDHRDNGASNAKDESTSSSDGNTSETKAASDGTPSSKPVESVSSTTSPASNDSKAATTTSAA
ncbi:MAG: zinc ribbon domain-containing protein [Ktedonobacteraceae bacterium]